MNTTETALILIVDDHPTELRPLMEFLEESGFRLAVLQSGEAALQHVQQIPPDLILLDVLMPEMDGFETCRRLKKREQSHDIPVIFLTALTDVVDTVKGFEAGGVDYLNKPIRHEELLARVTAHLNIRQLQQQLRQEKERFQSLTDATFEGILIHDGTQVLDVNQALLQLSGYQRSELLGRNVLELITPPFRDSVAKHISNGHDHPYEAEGLTKDDTVIPIEIQARPFPYQGHTVRVASIRDIGWRKDLKQLRLQNQNLQANMRERYKFGDLIGKSSPMQQIYQSLSKAAATKTSVLIYGESGTGKELAARTIHQLSDRKKQPFVAVNCGAIPENLFEREFFGHRKGAFTGADRDRPGYFDRAHHGTLFLDEIGELSLPAQVKLLRVLQEQEYTPLGATTSKRVDVRIIAATNQDLTQLVREGRMRKDFFYRIRVIVLSLPPLRERKDDLPLLIDAFLKTYSDKNSCASLPSPILHALCSYDWPGNVRELQNELQRYLAEQRLEFLGEIQALSNGNHDGETPGPGDDGLLFRDAVEQFEKRLITTALARHGGHQGKAAAELQIPARTLYDKMKKYGMKEE